MATIREGNKTVFLVVDVQVNVVSGAWEPERIIGKVGNFLHRAGGMCQ